MTDRAVTRIEPRGLSRDAAAAYVGLCTRSFDQARKRGEFPDPTLPGKRFDRILLDRAVDKLSGLAQSSGTTADPEDAFRQWKERRDGARAAQRR